jgi:hypothetical protein
MPNRKSLIGRLNFALQLFSICLQRHVLKSPLREHSCHAYRHVILGNGHAGFQLDTMPCIGDWLKIFFSEQFLYLIPKCFDFFSNKCWYALKITQYVRLRLPSPFSCNI